MVSQCQRRLPAVTVPARLTTLMKFAERRALDRAVKRVTAIGELSGVLAASHIDPVAWRRDVLSLLTDYILEQIEKQPLLLVVMDAHWIDPSTVDLLKRLAELMPDSAKLCVFSTMRPEHGGRKRTRCQTQYVRKI